jgi:hypothetical protein
MIGEPLMCSGDSLVKWCYTLSTEADEPSSQFEQSVAILQ